MKTPTKARRDEMELVNIGFDCGDSLNETTEPGDLDSLIEDYIMRVYIFVDQTGKKYWGNRFKIRREDGFTFLTMQVYEEDGDSPASETPEEALARQCETDRQYAQDLLLGVEKVEKALRTKTP